MRPFVSVILPIRNEVHYIKRSLDAVLNQTYPTDCIEIFVVDGMSDDGTRAYILSLAKQYDNLYILDNPKHTVPYALNIALRQVKGEIIVRVDGHCEIAPDYIEQCVYHLQNSDYDGVGGPILTIGETDMAQTISLAMRSRFGMGGSAFRTIHDRAMAVETVAFPAYHRATIEKVGLFDEELVRNQDDEYNYRLLKMGGKLLLTPMIRSKYYSRASFRKLWRQFYQYGYWKVRVLQKHPRQMRWRQFIPAALVANIVLLLFSNTAVFLKQPLLRLSTPIRFMSTILLSFGSVICAVTLTLYLMLSLFVSLSLARKHRWQQLPTLFISFFLMHIGYGVGFWVGLVHFLSRWQDKIGQVPNE